MGSLYKIKIPTKYDENLAYLHAVVCGDGNLTKNGYRLQISDKNFEMHKNILQPTIKHIFEIQPRIVKKGNGWVTEIKSKALFNYLSQELKIPVGEKSEKVKVPIWIFSMPINVQIGYLQGWMDAEGSVKYRKYKTITTPKIEFVSKSQNIVKNLIKILDILSEHFKTDLHTWKWKDKKDAFRFELAGPKCAINYNKCIGFRHPHKKEKIKRLITDYL